MGPFVRVLSMVKRVILGVGGGGLGLESADRALDDYLLRLSGKPKPRMCFVPTASGDSLAYIQRFYDVFSDERAKPTHLDLFRHDGKNLKDFLLEQDIIYVGGGNVMNLLAVWQVHGVNNILREAYDNGVLLCGVSAGMLCWFEAVVTDSYGPQLEGRIDGLGLLKGSACPHYDGEVLRRPRYHELIGGGFPAGLAADDDVALCFVDGNLEEVVASRPEAGAYRVFVEGERVVEEEIAVRLL